MKRKTIIRTLLAVILGFVLLGLAAPFLSANLFRERIRAALQTALNRKVEMGSVHFNLFSGPGFSIEDVLIADDAGAGIEPFAHVQSIKARIRFTSLFTGHLTFSKLKLVEPSVNLVKTDSGPWNIQSFFQRAAYTAKGQPGPHASVPDIEIVDGRINFKFGMVKSVFYISNADVSIYPKSADDVVIDFSGEPARTDTGAQGFGRFSAKGLLRRSDNASDQLSMALHLERSALSELTRLFSGRDLGVHGYVSSNATLSGPMSQIAIAGDLNVSGLHRWDLMPAPGEGWTLKYSGALDMRSQKLDLATTAAPEIPVALKFLATDFISAPKVTATMDLHDLPAASLAGTARHLGVVLPDNVAVDGKVNGAIGFSYPEGLQGWLGVTQASFKFPAEGSAQIDSAAIVIANHKIAMEPAELTLDSGRTARIQASYDADSQDFVTRIETKLLTADDLKSGPARLVSAESIPVVANFSEGRWEGDIRYEKKSDAPGQWSGDFNVQNALLELPGISAPLHINSAGISLDGGKVDVRNLRGRVGPVSIQADYRFDTVGGPHFMRLTAGEVELGQLERLLRPTFNRSQGLLANLRLQRAPVPEWLKERDLDGSIQIKLVRDGSSICQFHAHLSWTGAVAEMTNVTCSEEDMTATGRILVNLAGGVPQYHLAGQVQNFDFRDGQLDLAGQFDSSGLGRDLLIHATSKGTFAGRDIQFSAETALPEISGVFELGAGVGIPRLSLTKVQASDGVETFTGQGSSLADGRFVLELISGARKQVKLTGSLLQPLRQTAPQ